MHFSESNRHLAHIITKVWSSLIARVLAYALTYVMLTTEIMNFVSRYTFSKPFGEPLQNDLLAGWVLVRFCTMWHFFSILQIDVIVMRLLFKLVPTNWTCWVIFDLIDSFQPCLHLSVFCYIVFFIKTEFGW